jgi:hypothetical protein
MDIFKELVFKVHPDIVGNTPTNHNRMVEVNRFRKNNDILIKLAKSWGFELKSIPVDYTKFNKTEFRNWFFKIYSNNRIFEIKPNCLYITPNVIKTHKHNQTNPFMEDKFKFFGLLPKWNYRSDNIHLIIENSTVFKVVRLLRTTAKCVFVYNDSDLNVKQYNMKSVSGRRFDETTNKWTY